jgi:eukaryotic-like serine/threonine-protein kinase
MNKSGPAIDSEASGDMAAKGTRHVQPVQIGQYRIERLLSRDGSGSLYLAHDKGSQRQLMLKPVFPNGGLSRAKTQAYLAESHAIAKLDHPNIIPLCDAGSTEEYPFFAVYNYADGIQLSDWHRVNRASADEAAQMVLAMAEALHYAHRQGIVHRAIKPENIIIGDGGMPFILGFGEISRDEKLEKDSRRIGTLAYVSPEQASGEGHRVDARSDIFSLGGVFYELLTGNRPFSGNSQDELLEHIRSLEPPAPRQDNSKIPRELERVCMKALSKRASDRYSNAQDLADDLKHWLSPSLAKDIFLSHASENEAITYRLCELLEAQGIRCWFAPRDILPGDNYGESIIHAIEGTPVTVLLLSAQSNTSVTVAHEIERATHKRKKVVPVRLEKVLPNRALELHLSTAQWIDFDPLHPNDTVHQLVRVVKLIKEESRKALNGPQATLSSGVFLPETSRLHIVPKGLRSFDAHDADFFLELLPGPRDREGLPDSIRFWKSRIEELDASKAFAVGLIYGPSGCGKSSLVKAGLLPRLRGTILTVYVEATAEETESRLLNGLRKRCPAVSANLDLRETLAALREGRGLASDEKVLIVLDQFEQWLHSRRAEQNNELVQALRQCDGSRVQCVIMVRDDFWLAVSRFLRELEIRLVEGENSALVDLFDIDHARKVLAAFGRAFGKLPEKSEDASNEAMDFLNRAVAGLAVESKVISVRLALFAEMMKSRPWTPASLKEAGGTEGVGVNFLEETFSAAKAPPQRRYHQNGARAVLRALLPDSGTDIKGHMRSRAELLEASGYANRPKDFEDLLRILDSDVRLLTPTDPDGLERGPEATPSATHEHRYYQLTHDYLVPALREWLTRKQKETRRGRAELLLDDRAALWSSRPENRQLPTFLQWLNIRLLTSQKRWTPQQQKMMLKATRYHTMRGISLAVFVAIAAGAGLTYRETVSQQQKEARAAGLVKGLVAADASQVPAIIGELRGYRKWADVLLRQELGSQADDSRGKLNTSLALLPVDPDQVDFLYHRLLTAEPNELPVIREALFPYRNALIAKLWQAVEKPAKGEKKTRLRAAATLAKYDPENGKWDQYSAAAVDDVVQENPIFLSQWSEAFRPVKDRLLQALSAIYRDHRPESSAERSLATNLLADYASGQPQVLSNLLMNADEHQFSIIYPKLKAQAGQALPILGREITVKLPANAEEAAKENLAKRQANAALALLKMDRPLQVWPLLKYSSDPRGRSYLIHRFSQLAADASALFDRLEVETDLSIRRALILSLGEFPEQELPAGRRSELTVKLKDAYRTAADPGLHAAAEWLLRRWNETQWLRDVNQAWAKDSAFREERLKSIVNAGTGESPPAPQQWYVDGQGHTMVVIPGPIKFIMGSPPTEADREENEILRKVRIGRTIAFATKPVTLEQFHQFDPSYTVLPVYSRLPELPVIAASWYQAAAYCNWLSEMEHIPEDQWVYEAVNGQVTKMRPNYLQLTGYRLPTEAETEYAMRSGARTARFFGEKVELLPKYAWYNGNSDYKPWPVGTSMPTDLGFFDLLGNVWSWSQDEYKPYRTAPDGQAVEDKEDDLTITPTASRVLRGGAYNYEAKYIRSAYRYNYTPGNRNQHYGFRVARTIAVKPSN